ARAQIPGVPGINPFSFGVEAGPAFPVGQFGTGLSTGVSAAALVEARLPVIPIGLRLEGGYTTFGIQGFNDHVHFVSGTADAVLRLSPVALTLVRPYLIGGVGIYGGNQNLGTKAGVNIGGGIAVPLVAVTVFGEARYTRVFTDVVRANFIPVHVGLRF
ncbi:MAG TPA: hypothetical protein VGD56_19375, partial [Gemmatirosa sp.]